MGSLGRKLKAIYTSGDSYTVLQLLNKLIEAVEDYDGVHDKVNYTPIFVNGFEDDGRAYVNIYREDNELKIIVSGIVAINQESFTPGAVQTPIEFELDEDTSRKLYVGGSTTASGNVVATPGIYYNDINYQSTVTAFILKRISENGNRYQIRFTGSQLTDQSQLTDLNWRVTLAL